MKYVCMRYGTPRTVVTDNGTQFVAADFEKLLRERNVRHATTTPYHPEANGAVERTIRTIKETLAAICKNKRNQWERSLPFAVFAINTAVHESTNKSPFEIVFNRRALMPTDLRLGRKDYKELNKVGNLTDAVVKQHNVMENDVCEKLKLSQDRQLRTLNRRRIELNISSGQYVMLNIPHKGHKKKGLSFRYHGPYRVLTKINENAYELEEVDASQKNNPFRGVVHVKYMKPTHIISNDQNDADPEVDEERSDGSVKSSQSQRQSSMIKESDSNLKVKRPRGRPRKVLSFAK
ncbi:Gag-Uncharacterized protein-like protein [Leptotrombidium deliense]|uniref:Gag-Uncharacterized protein-like protein n=1 Tax=Leptotrombidium deliense TaxID=299467 RepID=A0A443RXN5_9ACAR|nr:Gag-Uncharacterized protein-like protein [Leptotrombidium deliense]